MEYKQPFDQLYDPHKKAQEAIDHIHNKPTSADMTQADTKD
jgi:hypothetical protein